MSKERFLPSRTAALSDTKRYANAMKDGLRDVHRDAIFSVFAANDRIERAVLFGPRATGMNTLSSDVIIALFGNGLTLTDQACIAAELDEVPMGQSVDLVLYDSVRNKVLGRQIRKYGIELYQRKDNELASDIGLTPGWSDRCTTIMGDCVLINRSTYSPTENWPYINYLDTGSITENRISKIQRLVIGRDRVPSRARRKVQPGDIVYSTVRPNHRHFGLLKRIPDNLIASTGFAVIRGKDGVAHTDFIYWFLTQNRITKRLQTIAEHSTSAYPSIKPDDIRALEVHLPSLPEQRAIAHILCTLDDKIELNWKMNVTLEATAQAIFKSWFVDFDPVRAKVEGLDTGLPKHIADLFPDCLVESEMGQIPKGWTVGALGDIAASRTRGIDPAHVAADTPYIGLQHMPRRSVALTEWGAAGNVSSRKSAFAAGDILFGKLRPYFHKVGIAAIDGICSTDIVVLNARMPKWSAFVLACVSSSDFVAQSNQTSTGTKMPRTSWQAMSTYQLCRPTNAIVSEFQRVTSPMLGQIIRNVHESRTLAAFRDTLLPKLVAGKLSVSKSDKNTL